MFADKIFENYKSFSEGFYGYNEWKTPSCSKTAKKLLPGVNFTIIYEQLFQKHQRQ